MSKYYRRPSIAVKAEKELMRLKSIETKTVRVNEKTWIEIANERDGDEAVAQWKERYKEQEDKLKINLGK